MPEPRHLDQREWLAQQFESLTSELENRTPSQWAEARRYLPPSVTPLPGHFRFEVCPYMREILDCLSVDSPIREVSLMKGAQITATTSIIENGVGYYVDEVKTAPMLMVTADQELAQIRMESYITPMLHASELTPLIKSSDEGNRRKTGKTDRKIEWVGGGFLIPLGAQNANKLRSVSIQVLLRDEIDAWPDVVGKDGDPIKLSAARTAAYESSRKIIDLSTPLIKGASKIEQRFRDGDQRRYYVCCLRCGFPQVLRWRRDDPDTGERTGIVWETEAGRLVPESVRYRCENCSHDHTNEDKNNLFKPENGAQWRPTAVATSPHHRSYHISALYSPVGMQTWASCVAQWLEAWDEEHGRPRDMGKLQVFYNNVLGEPFELRGEKLRFETVSQHRRPEYRFGQVPNAWASRVCGSPVLLLTAAVDVHKDQLPVAVFGWTRDRRAILIDYWRFEGDTEQLDDPGTWGRLRELIEADARYVGDDGKRYRVALTLIDSSYRTDTVYSFTSEYYSGVYPVKGRDAPPKAATIREFSSFTTPMGTVAYGITVDLYKDRWSAALRREWDGISLQPAGFFNAPIDLSDAQLRELTAEVKRERIESRTGKRVGWEWHRPSHAANELWDLLVYNSAALDLIAWDVCRNQLSLEAVNWPAFFEVAASDRLFFTE